MTPDKLFDKYCAISFSVNVSIYFLRLTCHGTGFFSVSGSFGISIIVAVGSDGSDFISDCAGISSDRSSSFAAFSVFPFFVPSVPLLVSALALPLLVLVPGLSFSGNVY